jgi:ribosomal protein L11 methyltransferase
MMLCPLRKLELCTNRYSVLVARVTSRFSRMAIITSTKRTVSRCKLPCLSSSKTICNPSYAYNNAVFTYRIPGTLENLDHLTPDLWDAGCQGLVEENGFVVAYFEEQLELPFGGTWLEADDTDWLEKYRASVQSVQIGRVTIAPPWQLEDAPKDGVLIVLEPGLAFGTGQHETTRLAIEALQRSSLEGRTVLDVGAGTGILAIAAAKLGARAFGVDNDANTVPVARENAATNDVQVDFLEGVLSDVVTRGPFDLIVANLFAELHAMLMPEYRVALEPNGRLILTGIMAGVGQADSGEVITWDTSSGRESLVKDALEREGFALTRREQLGDWVLLEASRMQ